MDMYIEELDNGRFGLFRDGVVVAVFPSFRKAKVIQLEYLIAEAKA